MKMTIKDWYQNKIAKEIGVKVFTFDIVAVSKMTEKAIYATTVYMTQADGRMHQKTMWIPKSCTEGTEVKMVESYEEAAEIAQNEIRMAS